MIDPRTPVLVGLGQHTPADRQASTSATELLATAARAALADAGTAITERIGYLGTVDCFAAEMPNQPAALGELLGIQPKETVTTNISGTSPVELLADAATAITNGSVDAALLGGVEVVKAWRDGRLITEETGHGAPDRKLGVDRTPQHEAELAAGLNQPTQYYPLFEHAVRAAEQTSLERHEQRLARLWSSFAAVAADNEHAWDRSAPSAETIRSTERGNRMVASPYRKLLTANIFVDQAAALVLCSAETARAAGIPRDRWVFVEATASANDHWFAAERQNLHRSPAIAAVNSAVRAHTRAGVNDYALLDLYSCFPCAVEIAATELGIDPLDPTRVPTVTGGLTFAGGPGSNYASHSIATMAARLRERPGARGLCTALGWFMTKHAAVSLRTEPPSSPYRHLDAQAEVDQLPRRQVTSGYTGSAVLETYTCAYDREGAPETGYAACLLPDGTRTFAATESSSEAASLVDGDPLGRTVQLTENARFRLD